MPTPNKNETKDEFVSRCIPILVKEGKEQDQAVTMCNSVYDSNGKKESMFSNIHGLEKKESETDDLIRGGYIATTHLDSGFVHPISGKLVQDKIAVETLKTWEKEINDGNPRSNKVSVHHVREPVVSGVGIKGTAKVEKLPDGEFGLYVDNLIDKTKDTFDDISYRINNGLIDSFSIEFDTGLLRQGKYYDNAAIEQDYGDRIVRTLLPGTILEGWTLASQPMNEHAIMIKEINGYINNNNNKNTEADIMVEKKEEEITEPVEDVKEDSGDVKPEINDVPEEEKELIKWAKEMKKKQQKDVELKEMKESILKDLKLELESKEVKSKVLNTKTETIETKELVEYKEVLEGKKSYSSIDQLKIAAEFANTKGLINSDMKTKTDVFSREYKMRLIDNKLEYKGLGITTNQNTDTDYLLSSAELEDIFDPIIYNILNQKTTTWNLLTKEDYTNKGNNQVQFRLKIAANSTAGAYTGNAISLGNGTRVKYMTKFKKYAVGIEVDGDMMASARPTDVFAMEIQSSTEDLMSVLNAALFAENGTETSAGIIGFEYITDQVGNNSLYNVSRSQANGLASTTTTDNYINGSSADISLANLRAAKRKAVGTEGADINNCVFITSFVQGDKFRGIYDASQKLVPTSTRVGFEGRPSFDGIPIFEDKDCNTDDWFLVDLETHKIAIWVPPTLEMLGKRADNQEGFIKTYFATYNTAPRRMVQIYSNATS